MAKIINVVYKVDDKELLKVKSSLQSVEKETKKSELQMQKLGDAAKYAGQSGTTSFLNFKNILGTITVVGIIAGLTQLGKKILDLGVKQEMLNVSFTTFLGSAARAKVLLAELTKFSIITPFTPDQVNNAAKTLLAFGVQARDIIPTLKILGDVSSGTGKDLSEMAVIFGQIRSTGRLMGQDLLQLINAGFNPLQIIAEKTGKSVAQLKNEMEKGLISFAMVEQAFKDATSEGGLFFNLMEKQSATVGGKLSTIAGNIEEIEKAAFSASKGGLSDFLDIIVEITAALAETEEQSAEAMGINLNAIKQIIGGSEDLIENLMNSTKYQKFFNDVTSLYKLAVSEIEKFGKEGIALEFMTKEIQSAAELRGITMSLAQAQEAANRVYKVAIDTHNEKVRAQNKETQAAITAREATNQAILTEIEEEKRLRDLKKAQDELRKAIDRRRKALELLMGVGKRLGKDIEEGGKEADERQAKREEENNERSRKNAERQRDANLKDLQDAKDEEYRILEEAAEQRRRLEEEIFNLSIQFVTSLLETTLMSREVDTQSIRDKYDRELELAGDNDRAKKEIEKKRDEELRAAEEKNKQIQKKNARTKILIDTAVAVIKTFSEFGYPAGIIPAALMTAIGALNIRNVGKYKDGGWIEGPGTATSDSVPIMASKDEFMVKASAAKNSGNLLEAINDRRIDDRILSGAAASGGSRAMEIDYARLGEEFRKGKVDYDTHGYTIMKGIQKGKNFKLYIRSKVQGY